MSETPSCNCASYGLRESFRHGLGCPYGQETARREAAELRGKSWGHKLTVHVYLEGEETEATVNRLIAAVNKAVPNAEFVGIDKRQVSRKPDDQVAT